MRRIAFIAVLCVAGPGLLTMQANLHTAQGREPRRPNVLLIVTDDQREGLEVMPHLRRRFVTGGRSYPEGFVTTPLCCPSRASIFTGRYAHNHGVINNHSSQQLDPRTMLQYYLQRSGYRTGIFGKFLNSWGATTSPPYFTKWGIFARGRDGSLYDSPSYNVNGDIKTIPGYSTTAITRLTKRFLHGSNERVDSKPWMAVVTPAAPHGPFTAEPKYRDAPVGSWDGNDAVFEQDRTDKPAFVQDHSRSFEFGQRRREKQLRTLMSVDDMIREIFRSIKRLNEHNTLAVFISDNGMLWAEHGLAMKYVPYTQAVRVPFLARWPGNIAPGSVDDRLVANIDIMPTVLDAADIELDDPQFDGKSLLDDTWTRDRLLLEFPSQAAGRGVPRWASTRTADYQYTEYYYDEDDEPDFREYYDLEADPWELQNLFGDDDPLNDPLQHQALHDQLASDRDCAEETCP